MNLGGFGGGTFPRSLSRSGEPFALQVKAAVDSSLFKSKLRVVAVLETVGRDSGLPPRGLHDDGDSIRDRDHFGLGRVCLRSVPGVPVFAEGLEHDSAGMGLVLAGQRFPPACGGRRRRNRSDDVNNPAPVGSTRLFAHQASAGDCGEFIRTGQSLFSALGRHMLRSLGEGRARLLVVQGTAARRCRLGVGRPGSRSAGVVRGIRACDQLPPAAWRERPKPWTVDPARTLSMPRGERIRVSRSAPSCPLSAVTGGDTAGGSTTPRDSPTSAPHSFPSSARSSAFSSRAASAWPLVNADPTSSRTARGSRASPGSRHSAWALTGGLRCR